MRRVLTFALILALGHATVATGQSLLDSARRAARDLEPAMATSRVARAPSVRRDVGRLAVQGQSGLTSSGLSARRKVLILLAIGVGVAGAAYAIDRRIEDPTPSSRGER